MISLDFRSEPKWLDLGRGVRVLVKPLTTVVMETARQSATASLRELRRSIAVARAANVEMSNVPNLDDDHVATAESLDRLVKALGVYGITEWEGVGDAAGELAPLTPENVERLLSIPSIASDFFDQYSATAALVDAEKKG